MHLEKNGQVLLDLPVEADDESGLTDRTIGAHFLLLLRGDLRDDLQHELRPPGYYSGGSSGLDAVEPAGVRHHKTFLYYHRKVFAATV